MERYRVTPADLSKRIPGRRSMALKLLAGKNMTPSELADLWSVHPTTAYRLLASLTKKGYASRQEDTKGFGGIYSATDKGIGKLGFLQGLDAKKVVQPVANLYPDLGKPSELVDGPVTLQRIIEVDYDEFVQKGIDALPSRVTLTEEQLSCEKKFDGWLSQTAGGTLYSRRGKNLSGKFPPIDRELASLEGEHLIGELVYWSRETGKMNESDVTRVAGTDDPDEAAHKMSELERKGFYQVILFDILANEKEDISKQPFKERRAILEGLIESTDSRKHRVTLSPTYELDDWRKVFKAALDEGGEGVVIKNNAAPNLWRPLGEKEAKPAGTQWKIKAVRTDDFIAFSAYLSEKESLIVRFGQFWKGELIEVGELNNFSAENTTEVAKRLKKGPFVFELAFQERFGKPPCRLRNPRFVRFRDDKPIESATLPPDCVPED